MLGAILAGGRSSRFGSDKAVQLHQGRALLDHARAALAPYCTEVVVCGRDWPGLGRLDDLPGPGLGPLGGICAALQHGNARDFATVMVIPCDLIVTDTRALAGLLPGPAVAQGQWLLGAWPTGLAGKLLQWLQESGPRAVRAFAEAAGARAVAIPGLVNVNSPRDLPMG